MSKKKIIICFLICLCAGFSASLYGVSATWNLNANGNWNVNGNWTPTTFPNATDDTASFLNVITSNRLVTLGENITVGTLNFDDNNNYTIQGGNTLTFQTSTGNAALNLTNVNGSGAHSITSSVSLSSSLTMIHSSTAAFTISGVISGSGGLTKAGTGTGALVLSSANSYLGSTSINTGFLTYNANGAIPAGNSVTIGDGGGSSARLTIAAAMSAGNAVPITLNSNGVLAQNSNITTHLSSITGSGATILSTGTAVGSLFQVSGSTSTTYSGNISGGATSTSLDPAAGNRLTKAGTSTLTLSGSASTFTSRTFIENGVIIARSNTALGAAGTNSGVFVRATGTSGALFLENAINLPKRVLLNGSGFGGTGALRNVSGNNTISGNMQIGWAGGSEIASGPTIQVDSGTSLTVSGVVSGANILTKAGTGTLNFAGTSANTHTGATLVNAGTLNLNKTAGTNAIVGNPTVNAGGTLALLAANQIGNTSIVTINGGAFELNANADTIGSLVFNSGTFNQDGATLTIANATPTALSMGNATTISGPITFSAAGGVVYTGSTTTATITGAVNLGTVNHVFDIADGASSVDMELSGILSNTGSITKSTGTGRLQYSGASANTYTGLTTINAGELRLIKTSGVVALAGSSTINAGGTLALGAPNQFGPLSSMTLGGGTFDLDGNSATLSALTFTSGTLTQNSGVLTLSNATTALTLGGVTIPGDLVFSGAGAINFNGAATGANIVGNVDLGASTRIVNLTDGGSTPDLDIQGRISGTGGLTKSTGAGTLEFSGTTANTFTGLTTLNAGTLTLNKAAGTAAIAGNATINAGGTLSLFAANQFSSTTLTTLAGGTFNMNGNDALMGSMTYTSGVFSQAGGTLSLASNATALTMGATTISGDLALTASGTVSFNGAASAATISGNLDLGGSIHTFSIANGAANPDMVLSGVVSGAGGMTKTGSTSVLQLSGTSPNTYTGLTTLTNGTLSLNKSSGVVAVAGDVTISGGTLLLGALGQIASTSTVNLNGGTWSLAGFDALISRLNFTSGTYTPGGATLTLGSNITALSMGATTLSGSVILSGTGEVLFTGTSGTATLGGPVDLGGETHIFNINNGTSTNDMVINNVISNGALTKQGAGRLSLSVGASNTFVGLTTVSEGTLHLNKPAGINAVGGDLLVDGGTVLLGASNQIPDTSSVTIDSGTFTMSALSETISELIFNGGSIGLGALTLGSATTALTMRDTTIPSGSVVVSSTGSVNFDATNDGTATIASGLNLSTFDHDFNIAEGTSDVDMRMTGVISGAGGGITKLESGTLEFSGSSSNTYSGLTTVTAGELRLNQTAGTNAIAGSTLVNGGTLSLANPNQIADTSSLTLDSGTFAMNGNDEAISRLTFNGGVLSQEGGTLTLQSGVTALTMRDTTISGNLSSTGGGDFVFDATNDGTGRIEGAISLTMPTTFDIGDGAEAIDLSVTGAISGATSIEKDGSGTLLLTGSNSYTGGTTVTDGVLQGDTNGLQGDIANESQLIFDQIFNGTYAGNLSGAAGTLNVRGGGLLELTGANSVGGVTTVEEGILVVNGTLAGVGDLTVFAAGTLQGDGVISKDMTLFGTLAPGNSIGTIFFVGDQLFSAGSVLENELNASTSDLVDITGSLTILPGATLSLLLEPDNYESPFMVTMVQTTTGVTGTFSNVIASLPLFDGEVVYTPTDIFLLGGFAPIFSLINSGNAGAVAACIRDLPKPPGSDLAFIVNELRNILTERLLNEAVIQLQPSAFTSLSVALQDDLFYVRNALYNHIDEESHSCCLTDDCWTLWATAFTGLSTQQSKNQEPGFCTTTPGVLIGADSSSWLPLQVGAGVGYTHLFFKWREGRGNADVDTAYAFLYGDWECGLLSIEGILTGSYNWYSIDRKIEFTGTQEVKRTAKSHPRGWEGAASLRADVCFENNCTLFTPYASVDYLYLCRDAFQESGAGSLNLRLKTYHADMLIAEGGIEFAHCLCTLKDWRTPYVQIGVIREERYRGTKEKALIEDCSFAVRGLNPSRTLLNVGAGLNYKTGCSLELSVFYKGKFGKKYRDNSIYFQVAQGF